MKRSLLLLSFLFATGCADAPDETQNVISMTDALESAPQPVTAEELETLRKAVEANPQDGSAQDGYAAALLVAGRAGDALTRLHALPTTPQRQRLRGDALVMLGRYKEAVEAYRAAGPYGDTAERLTETLRMVGDGAIQGRRWRDAASAYEELRADHPSDPLVLNNLAYAYGELKEYGKAIPLAREALTQSPREPAALDTLGWLLVVSGEDAAAGTKLLEEAAERAPADEAIAAHLKAARQR